MESGKGESSVATQVHLKEQLRLEQEVHQRPMAVPEPWCLQKELAACSHCVCFHSCPGRSHTRTRHRCPIVSLFGTEQRWVECLMPWKGSLVWLSERLVVSIPGKGSFASRGEKGKALHPAMSARSRYRAFQTDTCSLTQT